MIRRLAFIIMLLPPLCFAQPHGPNNLWTSYFESADRDSSQMNTENILSVEETQDGGIMMAGSFSNNRGRSWRGFMRKLDGRGREIWYKSFGNNPNDQIDIAHETIDGGFILGGINVDSSPGAWIVRTDNQGTIIWQHVLGWADLSYCSSIRQTSDGGYAITAYCTRNFDLAQSDKLVRMDSQGNDLWTRLFLHERDTRTWLYDVAEANNGDLVVVGEVERFISDSARYSTMFIARTNITGELLWERQLLLDSTAVLSGRVIYPLSDSGFLVACQYNCYPTLQLYLMRIGERGDSLWLRRSPALFPIRASAFAKTEDGFLEAKTTLSSSSGNYVAALTKLDTMGNIMWTATTGDGQIEHDGFACASMCDGGYLLAGRSGIRSSVDYGSFISRFQSDGPIHSCGSRPLLKMVELDQNYPNPCNASTQIGVWMTIPGRARLRLYDLLGRQVKELYEGDLPIGTTQFKLDAETLSSGSYFYQLEAGGTIQAKKMVIIR